MYFSLVPLLIINSSCQSMDTSSERRKQYWKSNSKYCIDKVFILAKNVPSQYASLYVSCLNYSCYVVLNTSYKVTTSLGCSMCFSCTWWVGNYDHWFEQGLWRPRYFHYHSHWILIQSEVCIVCCGFQLVSSVFGSHLKCLCNIAMLWVINDNVVDFEICHVSWNCDICANFWLLVSAIQNKISRQNLIVPLEYSILVNRCWYKAMCFVEDTD